MKHEQSLYNDLEQTENIISALQKVITLLDRIKNAIEESTSKIPRASIQLNTITQATEVATVEILDVLEQMETKIHMVENGLKELENDNLSEKQYLLLTGIKQTITELKESTINISVTLQVQDITSQKIRAANHLIESVRKELLKELNYFETKKKSDCETNKSNETENEEHSHAMDAPFRKNPEHQSKIDKVVSMWHENGNKGH